jgi:hypothetical protein
MLKLLGVGIILTILIIALGSMFGAKQAKGKELAESLYLRMGNLSQTIQDYNTYVKSTELRSMAIVLQSELDGTAPKLSSVLSSDFGFDPKKPIAKVVNSEKDHKEYLNSVLLDARLNGILDRTYANLLTAEVGDLIFLESDLYSKTSSSAMKELLDKSSANLENLHQKLFDFINSY